MTREDVARKVHWPFIIWLAGLVNVGAMIPQLIKIIQTKNTDGLAIEMFAIYFLIQVAFSIEGYFTRNRMLMVRLGLSAIVSASIIVLVIYIRHF